MSKRRQRLPQSKDNLHIIMYAAVSDVEEVFVSCFLVLVVVGCRLGAVLQGRVSHLDDALVHATVLLRVLLHLLGVGGEVELEAVLLPPVEVSGQETQHQAQGHVYTVGHPCKHATNTATGYWGLLCSLS